MRLILPLGAALLAGACGGSQSSPTAVGNTATDSQLEAGNPASGEDSATHDPNAITSCGCPGDDRTALTCPENGYGPASQRCADNPYTKYCGCPGDSPCGMPDPCGWASPCGQNPCGDPCSGNPCGPPW